MDVRGLLRDGFGADITAFHHRALVDQQGVKDLDGVVTVDIIVVVGLAIATPGIFILTRNLDNRVKRTTRENKYFTVQSVEFQMKRTGKIATSHKNSNPESLTSTF